MGHTLLMAIVSSFGGGEARDGSGRRPARDAPEAEPPQHRRLPRGDTDDAQGDDSAGPGFAVARQLRGIYDVYQLLMGDGCRACVYAAAWVTAAPVTASSCFGIGIPSFFSRSASSGPIFVR